MRVKRPDLMGRCHGRGLPSCGCSCGCSCGVCSTGDGGDKLQVGDHFSSISYLKVQKIAGDTITVENSLGGSWIMSKGLLVRDAWSADIFSKVVKTNMTELARILTECQDTVFTVSFKKKIDAAEV